MSHINTRLKVYRNQSWWTFKNNDIHYYSTLKYNYLPATVKSVTVTSVIKESTCHWLSGPETLYHLSHWDDITSWGNDWKFTRFIRTNWVILQSNYQCFYSFCHSSFELLTHCCAGWLCCIAGEVFLLRPGVPHQHHPGAGVQHLGQADRQRWDCYGGKSQNLLRYFFFVCLVLI